MCLWVFGVTYGVTGRTQSTMHTASVQTSNQGYTVWSYKVSGNKLKWCNICRCNHLCMNHAGTAIIVTERTYLTGKMRERSLNYNDTCMFSFGGLKVTPGRLIYLQKPSPSLGLSTVRHSPKHFTLAVHVFAICFILILTWIQCWCYYQEAQRPKPR